MSTAAASLFSNFSEILEEMKKRLDAQSSHMEITFPYFINKKAPVTGSQGLMEYVCTFKGSLNRRPDLMIIIQVPISTLCPCSKEISEFGAHNQRGEVRLQVRFQEVRLDRRSDQAGGGFRLERCLFRAEAGG